MTAAARSAMHEMLTLPIPVDTYLTITPEGVVWMYTNDPARVQSCFMHRQWMVLSPTHARTVYYGTEINVIREKRAA